MEIGAALLEMSNVYHMIGKILDGIYPEKARFVVIFDYVDTALTSKDVAKMDGPAFHRGSSMLNSLKESNLFLDISTDHELWDTSMVTMINLMLLYKERWTKNQHQIINDYEKTVNQTEVAEKHKISQQAVSKVIKSTKLKDVKHLECNINEILKRGV